MGSFGHNCFEAPAVEAHIAALEYEVRRQRAAIQEVLRHWPNDDGGLWAALDALRDENA